jgi:hypothetical protein
MKHSKTFFGFLVLLCAAALFLGCPTESDDGGSDGGVKTLQVTVTSADGVKYFSLANGIEVKGAAKIASKNWDIAFQRSRQIFTNSGATAGVFNSGGDGGVWFAADTDDGEKKAFSQVTVDDAVSPTGAFSEYADFTTDVTKYLSGMGGASPSRLNVMTYVGYESGDGSNSNPYTTTAYFPPGVPPAGYVPYLYNRKHFVTMTQMMPSATYDLTNQVYIIKHGDGIRYSKLEVTYYESRSADTSVDPPVLAADIYTITYQNF